VQEIFYIKTSGASTVLLKNSWEENAFRCAGFLALYGVR